MSCYVYYGFSIMLPGNTFQNYPKAIPNISVILAIFFFFFFCCDLSKKKSFVFPLDQQKLQQSVFVCMPALSGDRNSPGACRVQMASQLVMSHHAHPYQDSSDGRPNEEHEKTLSASQLQARPSWAWIGCWKWASGNLGQANGAIAVEKSRSCESFQNIHRPGRTWGERCCIITEQDG